MEVLDTGTPPWEPGHRKHPAPTGDLVHGPGSCVAGYSVVLRITPDK